MDLWIGWQCPSLSVHVLSIYLLRLSARGQCPVTSSWNFLMINVRAEVTSFTLPLSLSHGRCLTHATLTIFTSCRHPWTSNLLTRPARTVAQKGFLSSMRPGPPNYDCFLGDSRYAGPNEETGGSQAPVLRLSLGTKLGIQIRKWGVR